MNKKVELCLPWNLSKAQGVYGPKVFKAQCPKPLWLGVINLNAHYMGEWVEYELNCRC